MNAKQATFKVLDGMKQAQVFTGFGLAAKVMRRTGEVHYPATMLRYMREWRALGYTPCVECVSKPKSLYRVC